MSELDGAVDGFTDNYDDDHDNGKNEEIIRLSFSSLLFESSSKTGSKSKIFIYHNSTSTHVTIVTLLRR